MTPQRSDISTEFIQHWEKLENFGCWCDTSADTEATVISEHPRAKSEPVQCSLGCRMELYSPQSLYQNHVGEFVLGDKCSQDADVEVAPGGRKIKRVQECRPADTGNLLNSVDHCKMPNLSARCLTTQSS